MTMNQNFFLTTMVVALATFTTAITAEEVGERWGTADRERDYYRIVELPIPQTQVMEVCAFTTLPDGRIAAGTRHGEVYFITGAEGEKPQPTYELFASGMDEIFGLVWKDDALYVTQTCELTRVKDTNKDGKADRYECVSDAWGFGTYHEYAFGSTFDPKGNLYVALGLSNSYNSYQLLRGWCMKITPEGKSIPIASGMRSPGGIGCNAPGALCYIESQGPWNSSCSIKFIKEGGFMGHPASFNWYDYAPNMGKAPLQPESGTRIITERKRVPQLDPYAVIFPYIRMGRSITAFTLNHTKGKFGPFENQMFMGDYTLSLIMRATTEQVNGVWQGACYPFREGLSTGSMNVQFTSAGQLLTGGTNRGWPVRGLKPYALERLDWTGRMPFEIERITITPDGFRIAFTKAVDAATGNNPTSYTVKTFTHEYHAGYGGPELDETIPKATKVTLAADGMSATIVMDAMTKGHCHAFDLGALRSRDGEELLHRNAYYTVNEVPNK